MLLICSQNKCHFVVNKILFPITGFTLQNIYGKIYSTMTDRLATNKAVIQELEKEIGSLYALYCNVHPLDSMASQVKKILRDIDDAPKSRCFGTEGACGNTLYAISKLRHKATGNLDSFVQKKNKLINYNLLNAHFTKFTSFFR